MKTFLYYCVGGALAVVVHYLTLIFLVEGHSVDAVLASQLGFLFAIPVNFSFQRLFVFKVLDNTERRFLLYCAVTILTFVLNGAMMAGLLNLFDAHYLELQLVSTFAVLLVNYVVNSRWTFKRA